MACDGGTHSRNTARTKPCTIAGRWSDKGTFARVMAGLATDHGEQKTVMIDATYLKTHRTATSMDVSSEGQ